MASLVTTSVVSFLTLVIVTWDTPVCFANFLDESNGCSLIALSTFVFFLELVVNFFLTMIYHLLSLSLLRMNGVVIIKVVKIVPPTGCVRGCLY